MSQTLARANQLVQADQAATPAAVSAFQRVPDPAPSYPWWRRWADQHAGRVDGRRNPHPPITTPTPLATPWLVRLTAERDAALATEHRSTAALIAVLDDELAQARATATRTAAGLAPADQAITEIAAEPVATTATTSVERLYATDTEIRDRRAREHAARLTHARAAAAQLRHDHDTALERQTLLDTAITAHRDLLAIRTQLLTTHYQRRAAAYTTGYAAVTGQPWMPTT